MRDGDAVTVGGTPNEPVTVREHAPVTAEKSIPMRAPPVRSGRAYDATSGRQLAERIKSRGRAARAKKR